MITTHVKVVAKKKRLQALSLVDSEETLVVTLNNSAPNDVQLLSIVKDSLFYEEIRGKDMGMNNAWEQDLVTKNRVGVRVEGLIVIGNLMMDQKQVIHLSWGGVEKASIIGRKIHRMIIRRKSGRALFLSLKRKSVTMLQTWHWVGCWFGNLPPRNFYHWFLHHMQRKRLW